MRDVISSDEVKDSKSEAANPGRNKLYADKYQQDLFHERYLIALEQKRFVLSKNDQEVERVVHEIYDDYITSFSVKSERNVASCVAEYYIDALYRYMDVVLEELEVYCKATRQEGFYHTLSKIVSAGNTFLLQGLQDEIRENMERYELHAASYYVCLANYRLTRLRVCENKRKAGFRVLSNEAIPVSTVCETLLTECEEKIKHFIERAQHRYEAYIDVLRIWTERYQICLPDYADGEEWAIFCHVLKKRRKEFPVRDQENYLDLKKSMDLIHHVIVDLLRVKRGKPERKQIMRSQNGMGCGMANGEKTLSLLIMIMTRKRYG